MYLDQRQQIIITGIVGIIAAVFVCIGEYLLHYDSLARYSETNYNFMLSASDTRQTLGHFFGVLAAPLYIIGCWHIYLMLSPANRTLAFITFLLAVYGFIMGAVWISSRASIGAIIHLAPDSTSLAHLVDLYQQRYESLLTIIRLTTLILSIVFVYLVSTSKTYYQKWQMMLNPIVLLALNFVIYLIMPSIGKHMMPVALNIGFGIFFIMSVIQSTKITIK